MVRASRDAHCCSVWVPQMHDNSTGLPAIVTMRGLLERSYISRCLGHGNSHFPDAIMWSTAVTTPPQTPVSMKAAVGFPDATSIAPASTSIQAVQRRTVRSPELLSFQTSRSQQPPVPARLLSRARMPLFIAVGVVRCACVLLVVLSCYLLGRLDHDSSWFYMIFPKVRIPSPIGAPPQQPAVPSRHGGGP